MDREDLRDQVRMSMPIEATDVTDATIDSLLNQGLQEVALAGQWPWLQASTDLSLSEDTQTVALPNDFDFAVSLVDDDHDVHIPFVAPEDYFQRFGNDTDNTATTPNYWTIWENKIYLTPIPSADDTDRLTLYYYKSVTALTEDDDVPEFHTAFHPILVEYCKWKLYERGELYQQAVQAASMYASRLDQMTRWYGRQVKRAPYIAGDGDSVRGPHDPNIPFLRLI